MRRRNGDVRVSMVWVDRKSTRLNSSHLGISYAVFCLKKKKTSTDTLHVLALVLPVGTVSIVDLRLMPVAVCKRAATGLMPDLPSYNLMVVSHVGIASV